MKIRKRLPVLMAAAALLAGVPVATRAQAQNGDEAADVLFADRDCGGIDVGAHLGLTPRCYQSGEVDRSGRIFKCGDAPMCGQQNPQGNRPLHPKMSRT